LTTQCFAIDTSQYDEVGLQRGAEVLGELRTFHDPLYQGFSRLIQNTSAEASTNFQSGEIDLLHLNGCHSQDEAKTALDIWLPKLSQSGVLVFHNINGLGENFSVKRFWEQLARQYPHFSFLHQHGLGVLACGPDYPEALNLLFRASETDITLIRDI